MDADHKKSFKFVSRNSHNTEFLLSLTLSESFNLLKIIMLCFGDLLDDWKKVHVRYSVFSFFQSITQTISGLSQV